MKGIIDKSLDVNYNLDYIVIVPKEDEELVEFMTKNMAMQKTHNGMTQQRAHC